MTCPLFKGGLASSLALVVPVVHSGILVTDDDFLKSLSVLKVNLTLKILTEHESGQVIVLSSQSSRVGIVVDLSEFFRCDLVLVVIPFTGSELDVEGVGVNVNDKQTSFGILVGGVVRSSDGFGTVSASDDVHVFNTPAHRLLSHDSRVISNTVHVPTLVQVIVHWHKEEVIPLGSCVDFKLVGLLAPSKSVAVQISLGLFGRVRENFAGIIFRPAQIRVVSRASLDTVSFMTISIVVEILSVTVPAADSSIGRRASTVEVGCWVLQESFLGFVSVEFVDRLTSLVGCFRGRHVVIETRVRAHIVESVISTSSSELAFLLLKIPSFIVEETSSSHVLLHVDVGTLEGSPRTRRDPFRVTADGAVAQGLKALFPLIGVFMIRRVGQCLEFRPKPTAAVPLLRPWLLFLFNIRVVNSSVKMSPGAFLFGDIPNVSVIEARLR